MSTRRLLRRAANTRLVDQVGQIGAREARRAARDDFRFDVHRNRHLAHVHIEDLFAAANVRQRHHHLAVEAAWRCSAGSSTSGGWWRRSRSPWNWCQSRPFPPAAGSAFVLRSSLPPQAGAALATHRVDFLSMKMMHGEFFLAFSNMSRTRRRRRRRTFPQSPSRKSRRTAPWLRQQWPWPAGFYRCRAAGQQDAARMRPPSV